MFDGDNMGELPIAPIVVFRSGRKDLEVRHSTFMVETERAFLETKGFKPEDVSHYVTFIKNVDNRKQEKNETRSVYQQLRTYLERNANLFTTPKAVFYTFSTDNPQMKAFARSPQFLEVFGEWDHVDDTGTRVYCYKLFYPAQKRK